MKVLMNLESRSHPGLVWFLAAAAANLGMLIALMSKGGPILAVTNWPGSLFALVSVAILLWLLLTFTVSSLRHQLVPGMALIGGLLLLREILSLVQGGSVSVEAIAILFIAIGLFQNWRRTKET